MPERTLALLENYDRQVQRARTLEKCADVRHQGQGLLHLLHRRRATVDQSNAIVRKLIQIERHMALQLVQLARADQTWNLPTCRDGTLVNDAPASFKAAVRAAGLSLRLAYRIQTLALLEEDQMWAEVDRLSRAGEPLTLSAVYELAQPLVVARREQERQEALAAHLQSLHVPMRARQVAERITCQDTGDLDWPDGALDLVLTSPPYATGQLYDAGGDVQPSEYRRHVQRWAYELCRVLNPDHGRALVVVPLDTVWLPVSSIWTEALYAAGLQHQPAVVIHDGQAGSGRARGSVDSASSPCVVAPVEVVIVGYRGRWQRAHERVSDVDHYRWLERAGPRGLWTVLGARDPFGHPAPFSSRLVHDLLELFSFREDLVGDPFVGTGTTPAVCVQMGRQFVASDRSPRYVTQARARVAQALKSRGAA